MISSERFLDREPRSRHPHPAPSLYLPNLVAPQSTGYQSQEEHCPLRFQPKHSVRLLS